MDKTKYDQEIFDLLGVWVKTNRTKVLWAIGGAVVGNVLLYLSYILVAGRDYANQNWATQILLPLIVLDFLGAVGSFVYVAWYKIPSEIFNTQEKIIERLTKKLGPPFDVSMDIYQTRLPQHPPHQRVGIVIENHEFQELTDLYIRLIKETDIEMDKDFETRPTNWQVEGYDLFFDIGKNPRVGATDKKTFYLAEKRDNGITFLLQGKEMSPKYRFPLPQGEYETNNLRCELYFELHGKIQGNPFRKRTYFTSITSYRVNPLTDSKSIPAFSVSIDIGDVIYVQEDSVKENKDNH